MFAVFVNCAAIIVGSILGLLISKYLSEKFSECIQTAAGIVVMIMGIQMAFKYQNVVFMTLSLIIGGLLGSWWDIDGGILKIGYKLEKLVPRNNSENKNANRNFAYAFLNSSVLFCVGAMAIIGSFKAAIEKDYSIIYTKSILDGFMAMTFAAAMGPGTIFSALTVLIYQGALTLLSYAVKPYVNDTLINELTGTGGALILMIGINLVGLKKIKTANYLPAMLLIIIFVVAGAFFKNFGF